MIDVFLHSSIRERQPESVPLCVLSGPALALEQDELELCDTVVISPGMTRPKGYTLLSRLETMVADGSMLCLILQDRNIV